MAGSLAGAMMAAPVEGRGEPIAPAASDPRIADIEKSRGKPLTRAQRKAVLDSIKEHEDSWRKGRSFSVPDGTEPDFVFRPSANTGDRGRRPS